jgi:hypothetical protein
MANQFKALNQVNRWWFTCRGFVYKQQDLVCSVWKNFRYVEYTIKNVPKFSFIVWLSAAV